MLTTFGGGVTSWNHEKIPKCLSALFHTTFKHFASTKLIWHNKRKKILPLLSLLCSPCLYSSCQSVCLFGGRYTRQTGWTLLLGYIHIKSGCLAPSWRITWRCGSVCVITQNYCGDLLISLVYFFVLVNASLQTPPTIIAFSHSNQ